MPSNLTKTSRHRLYRTPKRSWPALLHRALGAFQLLRHARHSDPLYGRAPAQGGLGFDVKRAASIYGTYTMAVYITALPGGLAADYLLGARLAVFIGGLIIAAGHFSMVFHSMTSFYLGMVLIAVGTGLLKPNISAMVGDLYRENDPRRDSGFSIFYMGINVGAVLAPLVCGYLARVTASSAFSPAMALTRQRAGIGDSAQPAWE